MFNPKSFVIAGNAVFTLKNENTGNHFTYRISKAKNGNGFKQRRWFVSVLNGPDNYHNYRYMGMINSKLMFKRTSGSKIAEDATSFKAFSWMWPRLWHDMLPDFIKIHHAGKCGRCGRRLTVPESIKSGFGPECIGKI